MKTLLTASILIFIVSLLALPAGQAKGPTNNGGRAVLQAAGRGNLD